jgi:hypothetical protein
MSKKSLLIAAGVALAWFLWRTQTQSGAKAGAWLYNGMSVSPQQAAMLAEQDAAFAGGDGFLTAAFHS